MPFDTHDFQLDTHTITHILDVNDNDVLLVTVTGSGKTDMIFVQTMHTIQFLSQLRCPKFIHPSGSLIVCLTKPWRRKCFIPESCMFHS